MERNIVALSFPAILDLAEEEKDNLSPEGKEALETIDNIRKTAELDPKNREKDCLSIIASGGTLEDGATKYGITRERVRQIVGDVSNVRKARETLVDSANDLLESKVMSWAEDNRYGLAEDAATELDIPYPVVVSVLRSNGVYDLHSRKVPRSPGKAYSEEDIIDAVREFYARTGSASGSRYHKYVRENPGLSIPGRVSVISRIGSWSRALTLAGVPEKLIVRGRGPKQVFSDEACVSAVTSFVESSTGNLSYESYREFSKENKGLPSGELVRNRLGSWSVTINSVLDSLREDK